MSGPAAKQDVWVIEDNDGLRSTITRAINCTETLACSGGFRSCEAALEKLATERPPRVILLDINLPGMSGIEGIKLIKTIAPATDVIMLTVFDDNAHIFQALCAGASGYILKSSDLGALTQCISEVIRGGAPMTPAIARQVLHLFKRFAPAKPDYGLSNREQQTLQLLVEGMAKKEIANRLGLSYHTVDKHVRAIYEKLQVHSLSAAVAKAVREQLTAIL